jgi:hypothetical protein
MIGTSTTQTMRQGSLTTESSEDGGTNESKKEQEQNMALTFNALRRIISVKCINRQANNKVKK